MYRKKIVVYAMKALGNNQMVFDLLLLHQEGFDYFDVKWQCN